jgi:hypothetical protein
VICLLALTAASRSVALVAVAGLHGAFRFLRTVGALRPPDVIGFLELACSGSFHVPNIGSSVYALTFLRTALCSSSAFSLSSGALFGHPVFLHWVAAYTTRVELPAGTSIRASGVPGLFRERIQRRGLCGRLVHLDVLNQQPETACRSGGRLEGTVRTPGDVGRPAVVMPVQMENSASELHYLGYGNAE